MNLLIRLKRITLIFFVALVLTCLGLGLPTTGFGGSSGIYSFAGDEDGEYADTDLAIDGQGNLYGMAPTGGANGLGTIYQIHPDGNNWTLNIIHAFTGGADGATGSAGQMLLRGGLLYGAATAGGNYAKGTVFRA